MGQMAVIDPKTVGDVDSFWQVLAEPGHETIVHAGREEYLFCRRSTGEAPHELIDLQIAAGLIGLDYPVSYGNLIAKVLGKTLPKGETRTDWRRRPLTNRQIDYAIQDVVYLDAIWDTIREKLSQLGRLPWLEEELQTWQDALEESTSRERWRRVSGSSGLSPRSMAIVRELWRWREAHAQHRDVPARRVLRDDLIVEMARRKTADPSRIRSVRGMTRRDLKTHVDELSRRVQLALDLPDDECPRVARRDLPPQLGVLGQFLTTALGSICRQHEVAPSLVGTVQDVRDLIAYRLDLGPGEDEVPPKLATGWRSQLVGQLIDDVLAGKVAIRVKDPLADDPLVFET